MTVAQKGAIAAACGLLDVAEDQIARHDAEILLASLLGVNRVELYICDFEITPGIVNRFNGLVKDRAAGRPLQYLIGKTGFMGFELVVAPGVFIPRPETEILVEEALDIIKSIRHPPSAIREVLILDLCTGSGNIAIALTKFLTDCKIIASDISRKALSVAGKNARLNRCGEKIEFVLSDLFADLPGRKFDIIVSNPPYVASPEIGGLQKEIAFEPPLALDGGGDGLDFYRRIIKGAGDFLVQGGLIALEIGIGQAEAVKALLEDSGFINIKFIKDYNYITRIATAQWIN